MRQSNHGFTLVELLVSIAILATLVLFVTTVINNAATITGLGHKRMDNDSQARQLLDRMAIDITQMIKRSDVDYYLKSAANPQTGGNDQIAFYSAVDGYYPASSSSRQHSPISLVAYRVNSKNKLERMGKGLVWNGFSSGIPIVFLPLTISGNWPAATNADADSDYEEIGPQIFRFEYCYVLTSGTRSITPPSNISGIAAIIVDIATIDSKSKALITDLQITALAGQMNDHAAGMIPGELLANWQGTLDANTSLPRTAVSAIRLYERQFYFSPPTL